MKKIFWTFLFLGVIILWRLDAPSQTAWNALQISSAAAAGNAEYSVAWKRIPFLRPQSAAWKYKIVNIEGDVVRTWDFANNTLSSTASYADTWNAASFDATCYGYYIVPPDTLPTGNYLLMLIESAAPAVTDSVDTVIEFRWSNERNMIDKVVSGL